MTDPVLAVSGLRIQAGDTILVDAASFTLHRGEVLGFAGLIGAGRTDIGLALFGIEPATAGTVTLAGKIETIRSPRAPPPPRSAHPCDSPRPPRPVARRSRSRCGENSRRRGATACRR